jgi:hypothetical protein
VLAWHIREGHYGDVPLDGLNVMALAAFEGNIWAGETKVIMGSSWMSAPTSASVRRYR